MADDQSGEGTSEKMVERHKQLQEAVQMHAGNQKPEMQEVRRIDQELQVLNSVVKALMCPDLSKETRGRIIDTARRMVEDE